MEFVNGVDISMLKELEDAGAKFFDKGREADIFQILKDHGVNLVRLRIWNDPFDERGQSYGGGGNDYEVTKELAKRAKEHGMKFMLNFHYSDFWADPSKQVKPKAWKNFDGEELEEAVYNYTYTVVKQLAEEGVKPDMVQVGNELTNGMLFPEGKVPDYDRLCRYLQKGAEAVRAVDRGIEIILHLDMGGDNDLYRRWFDEITKRQTDFDIIGLSYYPYWHGTMEALAYNMEDISSRYQKKLMIVETAYGFTTETVDGFKMIFGEELAKDLPYPATREGQQKFLEALIAAVKSVQGGAGIVYWEPEWIPTVASSWTKEEGLVYMGVESERGNMWANQALFDFDGNALPALDVFSNER